jgi:glycerol-3-phosphate dehydrogenase
VFTIPWHEHVMVGTTDTPLDDTPSEPQARRDEIDFLLETVAPYLAKKPGRTDIRSIFAGIRPLVRSGSGGSTAQLSRDFVLRASSAGLVSIMGGKWTTYRKMAEDCVDLAARVGGLPPQQCKTETMVIHGGEIRAEGGARSADGQRIRPFIYSPMLFDSYGSDGPDVELLVAENTDWQQRLDGRLPYLVGQVVWAARREMARTVEDVLARRTRALFLDAEAALASAPRVAELLAAELGRDAAWQADQLNQFRDVADHYRP